MKEFKSTHMLGQVEIWTEDNFPSWINHKDYAWWRDDYLLKLEVGKTTETDFQLIERIK